MAERWYKNHRAHRIWWLDNPESKGEWLFSFDKKQIFNLFADYPHNLSTEQREIFDGENLFWKDFLRDRA